MYDKKKTTDHEYRALNRLIAYNEPHLHVVSGVACRAHRIGRYRALSAGSVGIVSVHYPLQFRGVRFAATRLVSER